MCMHYLYSLLSWEGESSSSLCQPCTVGSCLGLPETQNRVRDWGGVGKETNQSSCFDTHEGREIKAELLEVT